jgi:hypothetical protein
MHPGPAPGKVFPGRVEGIRFPGIILQPGAELFKTLSKWVKTVKDL